jgi:hypothetical protein
VTVVVAGSAFGVLVEQGVTAMDAATVTAAISAAFALFVCP